jgi:hypothetical protein
VVFAAVALAPAAWRVWFFAVVRVRRAVVFDGDLAAVRVLLRAPVLRVVDLRAVVLRGVLLRVVPVLLVPVVPVVALVAISVSPPLVACD